MPSIAAASRTVILTVDAHRDQERFGNDPGTNLLEHLRRHDAEVEVAHVASDGVPVAEVIVRQTAKLGADLLIIGAYSRPRTREFLFGSTTRSLLTTSR